VISLGSFPDPKLIEVAGRVADVHGLWIDQEHNAIPHAQLELMLIACRAAGLDAFARVPPTDYATIMRPMETGCSGVMVAQIRALEEVHQVVQWAKYPPLGVRGLFMANAECEYGTVSAAEHVVRANQQRWLAIQIETAEAVELADQIAATAGVDLLFVGPADLASTLGVPGESMHPKCITALERVSSACQSAGIPWGVLSRDPKHAAKCRELGCQLFSLASDMDVVHRGFQATQRMFADFFD
jgi:2-dehydro-3-deoxyglucarate aldolase/4-hydroxy-2-oxoheptanedioate aldolase